MKIPGYHWPVGDRKYNQYQSAQHIRISREQKENMVDVMKVDELKEPTESSPPGTHKREMKPITSTNSYLHMNLLHITDILGETRSSRDSVRRNKMVLSHNEMGSKLGFSTKSYASVSFFDVNRPETNWKDNSISNSNTIPQPMTQNLVIVNGIQACALKPNKHQDTVYLMKTYYWPPWSWLMKWRGKTKIGIFNA